MNKLYWAWPFSLITEIKEGRISSWNYSWPHKLLWSCWWLLDLSYQWAVTHTVWNAWKWRFWICEKRKVDEKCQHGGEQNQLCLCSHCMSCTQYILHVHVWLFELIANRWALERGLGIRLDWTNPADDFASTEVLKDHSKKSSQA